jgi:predicted AlkP superfamily phosphohydrolase/phosphomutase
MRNSQGNPRLKVLIIGIDGATFDLITPWVAEGKLPTFKRLLESGVHGPLTSTIPPVTAAAWTSFMTGKNPGKHGLYHFIEPQPRSYEARYTNARSRLTRTMWQLLNEAGLRVGVVNVPMTYPPEPVDAYMISGLDAPEGHTAVTYPPELYQELAERFGKVNPQIRYLGYLKTDERRDTLLKSLTEMDEHYCTLMEYLLQKYSVDIAMLVLTSTDTVQHFFWHYMDPQHPQYDASRAAKYEKAICRVYQKVDENINKLLTNLPAETALLLMSDHGFGPTSGRVLHLNRYLAELGLLQFTRQFAEKKQSGYHPRKLIDVVIKKADTLLRGHLSPSQKAKVARWFPYLRKKWESRYTGLSRIDWKRTKAYAYEMLTFPPSIWINRQGVRPEGIVAAGADYEHLIQFLQEKLYALRDPVTGDQFVQRVYRKEELYHGPYLDHAPDLTMEWWGAMPFLGKASFTEDGSSSVVGYAGGQHLTSGEWTGTHAMQGIVCLHGPPFQKGQKLEKAEIIDLAPTLLYLLGVPIPEDMDGRVLLEAFTTEFMAGRAVSTTHEAHAYRHYQEQTYSEDETLKVTERLRGLGYIE